MPRFLVQATYNADGAKAVLKGGGSARRTAVARAVESVGGKLEAMYFAFGTDDAVMLLDLPDNVSAAAVALAAAAAGYLASTRTTVLLTPEEIDQAAKRTVTLSVPGS